MKYDEVGGAESAHMEEQKCLQNFSQKTWREGIPSEDLRIDGRRKPLSILCHADIFYISAFLFYRSATFVCGS
jgi:hypothetical protein